MGCDYNYQIRNNSDIRHLRIARYTFAILVKGSENTGF